MESQCSTAICFLVVNSILELPQIAIESALYYSNDPIYIGYCNEADIVSIPKDSRVNLLKLNPAEINAGYENSQKRYEDFSSNNFYELVQLKWLLLDEMFKKGFEFVVYSDLDVIWNRNASKEVSNIFNTIDSAQITLQNFTTSPSDPKLCMGFAGFRNSSITHEFIREAKIVHKRELENNPKTGDDDVVTLLYKELSFPNWIVPLPQSTFPVGNLLNLYSTKPVMPGLKAPVPFIFHSNFVVGLQNKRLMSRLFIHSLKYAFRDSAKGPKFANIKMSTYWILILSLKRLRHFVSPYKKRLFSIFSK